MISLLISGVKPPLYRAVTNRSVLSWVTAISVIPSGAASTTDVPNRMQIIATNAINVFIRRWTPRKILDVLPKVRLRFSSSSALSKAISCVRMRNMALYALFTKRCVLTVTLKNVQMQERAANLSRSVLFPYVEAQICCPDAADGCFSASPQRGRLASTEIERPGVHAEVPLASLNKREILTANEELALAA